MGARHLVLALGLCLHQGTSQESQPARDPADLSTFGSVPKAGSMPAPLEPPAPAVQPVERQVALAKTDGVKIRSFEAAGALAFEKELRKDERVVIKGTDRAGGFFAVEVVSGLPGYVFAKYVEVIEPGKGRISGDRVSFRVQPKSGEPPATALSKGTEVALLGREGEWWRVLAPDAVNAWVAKDDLTLAGGPEAHASELAALREEAAAALRAAIATEELRLAKDEKRLELERKLKDAAARLATEERRPIEDADFQGLLKEVKEVVSTATEQGITEGVFVESARSLLAEVERKRIYQEAKEALASRPPQSPGPTTPLPERIADRDPLSRFEGVGYLLYRPTREGVSEFQLERGGQLLFYVSCSNGKYDLRSYQGRELGVRGAATRPEGARVRVLDVSHIEVLSSGPR
jgi:hypothetical protein